MMAKTIVMIDYVSLHELIMNSMVAPAARSGVLVVHGSPTGVDPSYVARAGVLATADNPEGAGVQVVTTDLTQALCVMIPL